MNNEGNKIVNNVVTNFSAFNLTKGEKELFYMAVNKLSRDIYKRGEINSSHFLDAIEKGEAEEAFIYIQRLSWRYPAIKILREVKRICKLNEDSKQEEQLERLFQYAISYKINDYQPDIIHCDACGGVMTTLDMTCPSCGKLVDE